ncbi:MULTISPECIES: PadR family transcriptional regulator [unclassified Curtobacterium]|uniref:PadR family transcriptional regulator n=1 Tax=unclassified Curtobacterium TaxID=257496 RepID=UPI00203CF4C7|nr:MULTISPECIES: PadR family transcriptional regulator [unclassified Curtobacterium]MCM3522599.1 PadR family transcriptional regulator [Curtobacterium sp. P97]MDT0210059.1 PadR family transcriptional regulator [Curtobacterium sp. BRD11]
MSSGEMREPTLLVLTALAGGRAHGYALIAEAESISDGRVRLKVGTLYAVLGRLLDQGLVQEAGEEVVDGRLRKYFEMTPAGGDALESEVRRLEANASAARRRMQGFKTGHVTGSAFIARGGIA